MLKAFFKDDTSVVLLGESLYKPPVTSNVTNYVPGIPPEPCFNTHAQAEQARDKRTEVLLPLPEAHWCGPLTLRPHPRMPPTVRWKEDWLMQDGNLVPDPICGRCNKKIEMAVRTEAVYQDKIWFHTACHRAGADQLFRATRLAAVLKDVKRGVDIITSPLF